MQVSIAQISGQSYLKNSNTWPVRMHVHFCMLTAVPLFPCSIPGIPNMYSGYNLIITAAAREAGTVFAYVANIPNQPIVFTVSSGCHLKKQEFGADVFQGGRLF